MKRLHFALVCLILLALTGFLAWVSPAGWIPFGIVVILVLIGVYDLVQTSHTILRNFPVIGHLRYLFEDISPEIQQYFIERHTDGRPISRNHRNLAYRRAKDLSATQPFGTELDINLPGYQGLKHSMYPVEPAAEMERIRIGGPDCTQPYDASLLNVSAMSFGSLSRNAILALNHGARIGGFYHNTGEGGLSPYHLEGGGDVVWQIGTAYFGCRTEDGAFDPEKFEERAHHSNVKMIELKLSQGAKPGHGGVLPAVKNTEEIAAIRLLEPHTIVLSPPGHSEFHDAEGLLRFIQRLRRLSGGKPTGFKLCIGDTDEFEQVCRTMNRLQITPDFVTVDGAEGGTGAAPPEFSDFVGMPMEPALRFVDRTLKEYGLRDRVKVIVSGKLLTGVSIIRALANGADLCNAARAFMLSVGCIQALRCDTNNCPTGVATQKPHLVKGLVVEDKIPRVVNFHRNTLRSVTDLMAAAGVATSRDLHPGLFMTIEESDRHPRRT